MLSNNKYRMLSNNKYRILRKNLNNCYRNFEQFFFYSIGYHPYLISKYPSDMLIFLINSPLTVLHNELFPPQIPQWSSAVFESTIQSQPTFWDFYEAQELKNIYKVICKRLTRQIPAIHMSLVPMLQGVPSAAESPKACIIVSSLFVQ